MESLVDDLADEFVPIAANGRLTEDGSFSLDLELEDDAEVETVGGYDFSRLGRPADVGDIVVAPENAILRVEEVDGHRASRTNVSPAGAAMKIETARREFAA